MEGFITYILLNQSKLTSMKTGIKHALITGILILLAVAFMPSCRVFSELGDTPLVMVTAATYMESGQDIPLLKFTIVYWADDISGLEIQLYTPEGEKSASWSQPPGVLTAGDPVVIENLALMYGEWRVVCQGTVVTNNEKKGKEFEDETVVEVTE